MMNFYMQSADVIVLPYDTNSCMNSGVLLLAFTNKRSVIVSDICMTNEFHTEMLYRYTYTDNENHITELLGQMERAYQDGKTVVREKGMELYAEILHNNTKEIVKKELFDILAGLRENSKKRNMLQMISALYSGRELWHRQYKIASAYIRNVFGKGAFIKHLKENKTKRIAIYGFGKCGRMLYKAMKKNGISVTCVIDQNARRIFGNAFAITLDDLREPLDIVVVTVLADVAYIRASCQKYNADCYVFSLGNT